MFEKGRRNDPENVQKSLTNADIKILLDEYWRQKRSNLEEYIISSKAKHS